MKRLIFCCAMLLFMSAFFIPSENVYAADTEAPVLNDLVFYNADNVKNDGALKMQLDVTEEGSGINEIDFLFISNENHQTHMYPSARLTKNLFSGKHTITSDVSGFRKGVYRLISVKLVDANGNEIYYNEEEINALDIDKTITITESNIVYTPTKIKSFIVKNADSIDAFKRLNIEIKTTGNRLEYAMIWFTHESGYVTRLDCNFGTPKDGKYNVSIPIQNKLPKGINVISDISIADKNYDYFNFHYNKERNYYYEESDPDTPVAFGRITHEIKVTASKADVIAPVINNISIKNSELELPSLLSLDIDITEEGSGIRDFSLYFKRDDGHTIAVPKSFPNDITEKRTGNWRINIPMGPFIGEGTYTLEKVIIDDSHMNHNEYTGAEIDAICSDPVIKLNSPYTISYEGSLGNDKVLDGVDNMGSGETAVLDCRYSYIAPKELFEIIAGTDKTIVFINDDVQWVFHGEKIDLTKCKTIHLESGVYTCEGVEAGFPDEDKVVVLDFYDNGELPGEADIRVNHEYITAKYAGKDQHLILTYNKGEQEGLPEIEDEEVEIEPDNAAVVNIDHNSTYFLSQNKPRITSLTGLTLQKNKCVYNGKAQKPFAAALVNKKEASAYYTSVKYKNNKNVGTASMTIKGTGIYKGTVKGKFEIIPVGTKITSIKAKKKSAIVKWKKQSLKMSKKRIDGYEIQIAKDKSFTKGKKTIKCNGYKKTAKKISKLSSKKTYYVHVRTFMKVNNKKHYSNWSKVRKVKIK